MGRLTSKTPERDHYDNHEFPAPEVIDLSNHISFLWHKFGETGKKKRRAKLIRET